MSNWYKVDSNKENAKFSSLLALTTQPNQSKCTFKPLKMSLFTISKFKCKLGTWSISCILMLRTWPFIRVSTSIEPLRMVSTVLLSPLNSLQPEMGLYMLKNALYCVMCCEAPESTIHLVAGVWKPPSFTKMQNYPLTLPCFHSPCVCFDNDKQSGNLPQL